MESSLLLTTTLLILMDMVWRGKPPIEVHVQVPEEPAIIEVGPTRVGCVGDAINKIELVLNYTIKHVITCNIYFELTSFYHRQSKKKQLKKQNTITDLRAFLTNDITTTSIQ